MNPKKYFVALLLFACMTSWMQAQELKFINVTGHLIDEATQEPLIGASLIVLNPADSIMASFGITNTDGKFILRRLPPGEYLFQISYIGYEEISELREFKSTERDFDIGILKLKPSVEMLDGALITDERIAVRMKKDTLIYNADAFKTQPNDVVEDLLKKMPGIEIESDGTIMAEGEEVEKIYVDGKEFFGSDPKMATKNLPARAIKEVQVFDKKSEAAEFSGIDDGITSKTINLKLKEDFKKGMFGNVTGGYGTEERYASKFNVNSFSKKSQVSALGQLNNINEQGFSFNEYVNFMGGMSNLMRGGRVRINSGNSAIPISNGLSNGDTRTGGAGLNMNHDFNKKTKLNATYFYSDISNLLNEDNNRSYFQQTRNFDSEEESLVDSRSGNHRASMRLDHEIDSTQSLKFSASASLNNTDYISNALSQTFTKAGIDLNTSNVNNTVDGGSQSYQGELVYRKKFKKKGRSVNTSLSYGFAPQEQDARFVTENMFFQGDTIQSISTVQDQIEETKEQNLESSTTWTEPLGGRKYLGITYTYNRINNDADLDVFDVDEDGSSKLNTNLTNSYDQLTQYHLGQLGFRWIFEKSNLNIRMGLQNSSLNGGGLNENYVHLLPSLQWNYDIGRTKSFSINYSTEIEQPTLRQLQPILDNADPLNLYIGNPNLIPEYQHNVRLRFRNWSQFSNTSLFGNLNFTVTENQITNATTISPTFVRSVTPVNIDKNFSTRGWVSFSAPLGFMGSKFRLSTNGSFTDGQTFINNSLTDTERWTTNYSISIENKKKEVIDWSIGAEFGNSISTYSSNDLDDQRNSNQTYFVDVVKELGSWTIGSDLNMFVYDDNFSGGNQVIPFWNAYVSKILMKSKLELKLQAFDLLNRNVGYSQNINLNYIEETTSNTIGQYFMLSATYTLGQFKENAFQMTGHRTRRR